MKKRHSELQRYPVSFSKFTAGRKWKACLHAICGLWFTAGVFVGCRTEAEKTDATTEVTIPKSKKDETAVVTKSTDRRGEKIRFDDVTEESQIKFTYRNGQEAGHCAILESLGGGVGIFDFDQDGWLDVFFPGGGGFEGTAITGLPSVLFRNLGGWKFTNVTQPAGAGFSSPLYTHGVSAADFDNDGFPDILVSGYGGLQLWHNLGDGTLREIHEIAGLDDKLWSTSMAWGDVNNDGNLDVYIAHYTDWSFKNHPFCSGPVPPQRDVCPPKSFAPLPDTLYVSRGDGTFFDDSKRARLRNDGKGLGVLINDVDDDGDVDIYVANDTTDNFLYLNDGTGVFEEVAQLNGVAADDRGIPNGSMGVDLADYNKDGRPDIWVANYEVETFALYRNEGRGQFLHVSQATGLTALNGLFVGFGTVFLDADRDGFQDIVVSNGHVVHFPRSAPLRQQPLLLMNDKGRYFRRLELGEQSYFAKSHSGRGLATGDLDGDGDLDLVFANNNEPSSVLLNSCDLNESNGLEFRFVGTTTARTAVGAKVVLEAPQPNEVHWIKGGGSYLSQSDYRVFATQSINHPVVQIEWPSGVRQKFPINEKRVNLVIESNP